MFLKYSGHERIMFGMFSTCFKPQNTCRSHMFAIFVDFPYQYVENDFFRLKKYFQTHVNQIPYAVLSVCVARTWDYVRLKALTLGYVLNTHIMGVECLENFLRAFKGRGFTFFRPGLLSRAKSGNFSKSKKWILVVKMTWKKFFYKCFWGVWNMKKWCLGCF